MHVVVSSCVRTEKDSWAAAIKAGVDSHSIEANQLKIVFLGAPFHSTHSGSVLYLLYPCVEPGYGIHKLICLCGVSLDTRQSIHHAAQMRANSWLVALACAVLVLVGQPAATKVSRGAVLEFEYNTCMEECAHDRDVCLRACDNMYTYDDFEMLNQCRRYCLREHTSCKDGCHRDLTRAIYPFF